MKLRSLLQDAEKRNEKSNEEVRTHRHTYVCIVLRMYVCVCAIVFAIPTYVLYVIVRLVRIDYVVMYFQYQSILCGLYIPCTYVCIRMSFM